jgi:hypothetical protein
MAVHIAGIESIIRLAVALAPGSAIDPTRVAGQVVTGIGFLGAGVILTNRSVEEALLRSLLLHALSQASLGLRRIDSADIPDTAKLQPRRGKSSSRWRRPNSVIARVSIDTTSVSIDATECHEFEYQTVSR